MNTPNTQHTMTTTTDTPTTDWDFEVWDIAALSQQAPNLVSIEPKRAEILKRAREIAERLDGDESLIGEFFEHYGIRTFKKPIVASR